MKKIIAAFLLVIWSLTFFSCASTQRTTEVPFDVQTNWPVVKLTLNGKTGYFLVDTGCSISVISADDADTLGVKIFPYMATMAGLGGESIVFLADTTTVHVKANDVALSSRFIVADLVAVFEPYERATGRNLVGIIGVDIFEKYRAQIDFHALKITFDKK